MTVTLSKRSKLWRQNSDVDFCFGVKLVLAKKIKNITTVLTQKESKQPTKRSIESPGCTHAADACQAGVRLLHSSKFALPVHVPRGVVSHDVVFGVGRRFAACYLTCIGIS